MMAHIEVIDLDLEPESVPAPSRPTTGKTMNRDSGGGGRPRSVKRQLAGMLASDEGFDTSPLKRSSGRPSMDQRCGDEVGRRANRQADSPTRGQDFRGRDKCERSTSSYRIRYEEDRYQRDYGHGSPDQRSTYSGSRSQNQFRPKVDIEYRERGQRVSERPRWRDSREDYRGQRHESRGRGNYYDDREQRDSRDDRRRRREEHEPRSYTEHRQQRDREPRNNCGQFDQRQQRGSHGQQQRHADDQRDTHQQRHQPQPRMDRQAQIKQEEEDWNKIKKEHLDELDHTNIMNRSLPVWVECNENKVPSWNRDLIPEVRPQPPRSPVRVDNSLMKWIKYAKEQEEEEGSASQKEYKEQDFKVIVEEGCVVRVS